MAKFKKLDEDKTPKPDNDDWELVPEVVTIPKEEPKKAPVPKPMKKEQAVKAPPPQSVDLRVYLSACGKKPDQTAGFLHWATKQKLKATSIKEWDVRFNKFMARPVK